MTRQLVTESPEKTPQHVERREPQSASAQSFPGGPHPIHQLQRMVGNRRVAQLIQAKRLTPDGKMIGLQRKLTVGAADDPYEQEADRVARHVMHTSDAVAAHSMQRAMSPEEDQDQMLQPKPLAASITPFVQRQMGQNAASEDEEQPIQAKLLTETSQAPLQRQPETEEDETEPLQAKSAGALTESFEAGADVERRVSLSKGRGSPLPDPVRAYMEPRFGVDFNQVRAHTGSDALQMNQAVGAQAFTHGSDIYFGAGHSPTNLELTAHELTHVVQQTGGVPLQTNRLKGASLADADPSIQRTCAACSAGRIEEQESGPNSVHEILTHETVHVSHQDAGIQPKLDIAKPVVPVLNATPSIKSTATVAAEPRGLTMRALAVPPSTASNGGASPPAAGKTEVGHEAPFTQGGNAPAQGKAKDKETPAEAATAVVASVAAPQSTVGPPAQEQQARPAPKEVSTVGVSPQAEAVPSAPGVKAPSIKPSAESVAVPSEKAKEGLVRDKAAAGGAEAGEDAPEAAAAPSPREAIAPAISAVRHRAAGTRHHSAPDVPVASAQAAAKIPQTEKTRTAAAQTVTNLDAAAKQSEVENDFKSKFKADLQKAIDAATLPKPKTESEADRVVKSGAKTASGALQGQLATQRDAATGPLKSAAASEVSAGQIEADPTQATLKPEPIGPPPAPVSAAPVVPEPLPTERLDYSSDREPTDRAMAENNVTKEQLEKGNEAAFGPALEARSTAEQHAATAGARYRQSEAQVQKHGQSVAQATLDNDLAGMHGARAQQIMQVAGRQVGTEAKDKLERQRITNEINRIKNETRDAVSGILTEMEGEANKIFEAGLRSAEKAYSDTFEEEKGGTWTWLTTWGSDWEELIETSLDKARNEYLRLVSVAIDQVADCVEAKLAAAKKRVADGLKQVETFVSGLDISVQKYGAEALQGVTADFEAMGAEIDQRRDSLVDKLTQQYTASYERMSAMEEKLREENKSLWQKVYDATIGLIKKILAFKDMLLSILAGAASVILDIISDPIGFLGNLVSGIKRGLENFMGKIDSYLQKGLMEWLFGALAGIGLQLPDKFDLQGIISIVLQILGLTYAKFRARAVALVGEPVVAKLEEAAEVFKIFLSEGVFGIWEFIKEQLADLKSMVLDTIFGFIKERVIIAGITWIIGLLNPASAFFKACKAIYDIVVFFINRGSQIIELVNAVVDSVAAIAKGALSTAIGLVEGALAKTIPVAIGFLASLLGLGDPAAPVRETIEKARSPVDKAIDWVINLAVKGIKAAGKFVGGLLGGKSDKGKKDEGEVEDGRSLEREDIVAEVVRQMGQQTKATTPAAALAEKKDQAQSLLTEYQPMLKQGHLRIVISDTSVAEVAQDSAINFEVAASPGKKGKAPVPIDLSDASALIEDAEAELERLEGKLRRAIEEGKKKPTRDELTDVRNRFLKAANAEAGRNLSAAEFDNWLLVKEYAERLKDLNLGKARLQEAEAVGGGAEHVKGKRRSKKGTHQRGRTRKGGQEERARQRRLEGLEPVTAGGGGDQELASQGEDVRPEDVEEK